MNALRRFRPTAGVTAAVLAATLALAGVVVLATPPGGDGAAEILPQETESDAPTEAPALESLRVATYEVFLARDPFEPILPDPVAPAATPSPTDGNATPTPGATPTDGNATPTPGATPTDGGTASPAPGADGCQQGQVVVCEGRTVSLVDVFSADGGDRAVVQVDSGLYEVAAGDTFATNFRVLSITPPCVTLLYGDDSFTLCEGETVLK